MAESKRRGEDAGDDGRRDERDEVVDEVTADDADDDDARRRRHRRGRAGIPGRHRDPVADPRRVRPTASRRPGPRPAGWGCSARIARFFREVVAELRKVIWPTRKELLTYTAVVVVFVAVMLTIVGLLDFGFAKGVLLVFGSPS